VIAEPSLRARWLAHIAALPPATMHLVDPVRDARGVLVGGHRFAVDHGLRPSERKVAVALAELLGCDGGGSPGVARIREAAGVGSERVSAALRRLEQLGLLDREGVYGRGRCDRFELLLPGGTP
jgi:DNA-binding MarR family transcriptional regulator